MRESLPGAAGPQAVTAIIPCLNEEETIGRVVNAVRSHGIGEVIVVDGGSSDRTVEHAEAAGARVLIERGGGYGQALMTGVAAASLKSTVLLFLDGDGSDRAEAVPDLLAPIFSGRAVFVHGSRTRGEREPGSLGLSQQVAGLLAGVLIRLVYGARFSDMSPFRAIRREVLDSLGMQERTYGWNLEMLMRIAAARYPFVEIAVGQRRRAGGVSKVSGNLAASVKAAFSIATTFIRLASMLRRTGQA